MKTPMQLPTELVRVYEYPPWDTLRIMPASEGDLHFFRRPAGQVGEDAILADQWTTNISERERLPNGQAYFVRAVEWQIWCPDDDVPRQKLLPFVTSAAWSWEFLNTTLPGSPLTMNLVGEPIDRVVVVSNAEDVDKAMVETALGYVGRWTYEDYPPAIPANATFCVRVSYKNPTNLPIMMRVCLLGSSQTVVPAR